LTATRSAAIVDGTALIPSLAVSVLLADLVIPVSAQVYDLPTVAIRTRLTQTDIS
jgi:hypothetical protein